MATLDANVMTEIKATESVSTRPIQRVRLQQTIETGLSLDQKLLLESRVNFTQLAMITPERWEGEQIIPTDLAGISNEDSWFDFAEKRGIRQITAIKNENSVSNDIPFGQRQQWAVMTGLMDFRFDVIGEGSSKNIKLSKDRRVIEIIGGWCSDRKVMKKLASQVKKAYPNDIVAVMDHIGQNQSGFTHPNELKTDPIYASLTHNLLSLQTSLGFYGLSDEQLTDQGIEIVKIVHSREAAAHLHDAGILKPNIKYLFLAPVLGHDGLQPAISKNLLKYSTELGGVLQGYSMASGLVSLVSEILTKYYTGSVHQEAIKFYLESLSNTNRDNSPVIPSFIYNLYQVDFPNLSRVIMSPQRHKILMFNNDAFVNLDGMIKAVGKGLGSANFNNVVKPGSGDHHEFLTQDSWANKSVIDFLKP